MSEEQSKKINVLMVKPLTEPYETEIEASLESMQFQVGGDIEAVYPFEDDVAIVCNDEGKINGLPLNRAIDDENGKPVEVIAGNFFICGLDEEGEFSSLPKELTQKYYDMFKVPQRFIITNRRIYVMSMERADSVRDELKSSKAEPEKPEKPEKGVEPEL